MDESASETNDCVDWVTSLRVGAAFDSWALRNAFASSTIAVASAGVNSGNTVGAMVNSVGSRTSSQEMKKRSSFARASGVASTWSTVDCTSPGVARPVPGLADDRPTVSGGASASV
jgi:hypothetical protein